MRSLPRSATVSSADANTGDPVREHGCVTLSANGRPAFVVNVSVLLRRHARWLLIERGAGEAHAAGRLSDVGGKVDATAADEPGILESTARREVFEEVGLDLTGLPLRFAESALF